MSFPTVNGQGVHYSALWGALTTAVGGYPPRTLRDGHCDRITAPLATGSSLHVRTYVLGGWAVHVSTRTGSSHAN